MYASGATHPVPNPSQRPDSSASGSPTARRLATGPLMSSVMSCSSRYCCSTFSGGGCSDAEDLRRHRISILAGDVLTPTTSVFYQLLTRNGKSPKKKEMNNFLACSQVGVQGSSARSPSSSMTLKCASDEHQHRSAWSRYFSEQALGSTDLLSFLILTILRARISLFDITVYFEKKSNLHAFPNLESRPLHAAKVWRPSVYPAERRPGAHFNFPINWARGIFSRTLLWPAGLMIDCNANWTKQP